MSKQKNIYFGNICNSFLEIIKTINIKEDMDIDKSGINGPVIKANGNKKQ